LYNSGNAYNKLEEYDEAIKSYEKALKIKKDTDTKFQILRIAKKLKKQQKNNNKKIKIINHKTIKKVKIRKTTK
jgi:Ca-activated chloride channel family protein